MRDDARVMALKQAILDLPEDEREQLAAEVLPVLLNTQAGLKGIDHTLEALSDEELGALVERARQRTQDLPEATVAAVIDEALRAVRAQNRP